MKETKYWFWHLVAGALVFVLLGLHMVTMHLDKIFGLFNPTGHVLDWESVFYRSKSLFLVVVYILLLGCALYHGLYGLRTIIFELGLSKTIQKNITKVFIAAGVCLFIIGTIANTAFILCR